MGVSRAGPSKPQGCTCAVNEPTRTRQLTPPAAARASPPLCRAFEYYPPRTDDGVANLVARFDRLRQQGEQGAWGCPPWPHSVFLFGFPCRAELSPRPGAAGARRLRRSLDACKLRLCFCSRTPAIARLPAAAPIVISFFLLNPLPPPLLGPAACRAAVCRRDLGCRRHDVGPHAGSLHQAGPRPRHRGQYAPHLVGCWADGLARDPSGS